MAGAIIPLYLTGVVTAGTGFTLELALAAAGVVLGLIAVALMTVYTNPRSSRPVSRAKAGYAALWINVIAARPAFSYGSTLWFGPQLANWMTRNAVSAAAIDRRAYLHGGHDDGHENPRTPGWHAAARECHGAGGRLVSRCRGLRCRPLNEPDVSVSAGRRCRPALRSGRLPKSTTRRAYVESSVTYAESAGASSFIDGS